MLGRGAGVEIPHWNTLDNKEVKAGVEICSNITWILRCLRGGRGLRFLITLNEMLGRWRQQLRFVLTLREFRDACEGGRELRFVLTLRKFRNAWKGGQGLRFLITLHEILGRGGRGLKFVFILQGSILRYLGSK